MVFPAKNVEFVVMKKRPAAASSSPTTKRQQLLDKYSSKLAGAKFRLLNQNLYTSSGAEALETFSASEFALYHQGFAKQVGKWPTNPVDVILEQIILPSKKALVIGDFGCGDARIARTLQAAFHTVHSFDLVSCDEALVVKCDMAHVPLSDNTLDLAVYALSLMGTNVTDFLCEAHRVTKPNGRLVIAEVKSRFASANERTETGMLKGIHEFIDQVSLLGFKLVKADVKSNKMFVLFTFVKCSAARGTHATTISLRPCEYKRR
jgi:ribosomal RNA-processing protein 8